MKIEAWKRMCLLKVFELIQYIVNADDKKDVMVMYAILNDAIILKAKYDNHKDAVSEEQTFAEIVKTLRDLPPKI